MNEKIAGNLITYLDEYELKKKLRSLRKYCMRSYKDFIFNIIPELKNTNFKNGSYKKTLTTDSLFKVVYGEIELVYSVCDGVICLEDLVPSDFFVSGFKRELEVYKGIVIRDEKDIFKVNLLERLSLEKGEEV